MEEHGPVRPAQDSPDPGNRGAAVRTPSKPDSPPPGITPESDSPTLVDIPSGNTSDAPDAPDAPTMIDSALPQAKESPQSSALYGQPILQPGTVLGQRYMIMQLLGEGGMGAVYKAKDRELNRMVALKVIRPDLARNESIIQRFKQELILAHQVTHKNVIRIYDLGEAEGLKFITMEYIEGEDLRALIQEKKKLQPEEAVEIMQQVCRALEAAHSVGVIHRDLKPQNI